MSEEFYPEHEIHTDPVENQQTEQQTWQAAQQQTAQQTWQAAPQQPSSPAPEAKKKGGKAAESRRCSTGVPVSAHRGRFWNLQSDPE